jgi:hypothetical protein
VKFLGLFVKLALQTNKKLGLKSLQWVLLYDLRAFTSNSVNLQLDLLQ